MAWCCLSALLTSGQWKRCSCKWRSPARSTNRPWRPSVLESAHCGRQQTMLTEETNKEQKQGPANPEAEITNEESAPEETGKGNWREAFLSAFQTARRKQKPAESRQELGRDKSKSLFLLVGVCVALLLLFLGIFSRPKQKISLPGENPRGEASLGRKVTPGQENSDPTKSTTPMLSADVRSPDPALAGQLTPEDIGRTSRTGMVPRPTVPTAGATDRKSTRLNSSHLGI